MATRTVTAADYIRPYRGPVRLKKFPEGASQTFKKGYMLKFGADAGAENRVIVVGADPTLVIGVAAQDASGTTDAEVAVWLAEPGVEFLGVVQDTGALDQTNLAAAGYGMVADATNTIHRVDLTETTAKVVHITELIDADADVNGRVAFQFLPAVRAPFVG
jgi:hypothetical protein